MGELLCLVKLDWITVRKKSFLPMLLCMVFVAMLGWIFPPLMACMIPFSGLIVYSAFSIGERSGFHKLYGVLPIRRSSIVFGRFLAGMLVMLAVTVIAIILGLLAAAYSQLAREMGSYTTYVAWVANGYTLPMVCGYTFLVSCVLAGFQYTMVWLFGVSRELPAVLGGILLAIIVILICRLKFHTHLTEAVIGWFARLRTASEALFYITLYGLGIVMMLLFALLTHFVVSKREL